MKIIIYTWISLILLSCNTGNGSQNKKIGSDTTLPGKPDVDAEEKQIQYTEQQLEFFLDSLGKLPTTELMDKVSFRSDSIFKDQQHINKTISILQFEKLKEAIKEEKIDIALAKDIFGSFEIDTSYLTAGEMPVVIFSFDKNKNDFKEFAICLGGTEGGAYGWSCELFFLNANKILTKHNIYHRYGLELEHYKDHDGKTVIYYKENYMSGSGIWWFNFYFYKYYNNELIPVLNELENGNLQQPSPWGFRILWLESFVKKTDPLTIKMVYYQELIDTSKMQYMRLVKDSTFVEYSWDNNERRFQGRYERSKITKAQILSYYLEDNESLFMNAFYKILKNALFDKQKRPFVLNYLNEVKNHCNN